MGLDFFSNKDILSSYFPSKSNHVISNVFFSMDRIAKEKKKRLNECFINRSPEILKGISQNNCMLFFKLALMEQQTRKFFDYSIKNLYSKTIIIRSKQS